MTACPFCETNLPEEVTVADATGLGVCTHCFNPVLVQSQGVSTGARPLPGARDVRQLAPAGSIGAKLLEQALEEINELPVLPEVSQRILKLLKDPDFGLPELTALIREDPVIAVAVMKQANSAAFGGLHEIKDLNGACARLGMKNVANTVQLVANRNLFITGNTALKGRMNRLWKHSVATAHCANEIARVTLTPDQESVFLAGLVHDIGKVLLLEIVASPRDKAIEHLQGNAELLHEVMDSFHPIFGLLVCQSWKLPATFRSAVYFHHQPDSGCEKAWLNLTHIIALANTIVTVEGFGSQEESKEVFLASHPSSIHLGLSDIKLATLRVDLADTLEALFEVAG